MNEVDNKSLDSLRRAYEREKKAKQEAEKLIEEKSAELYHINRQLEQFNNSLEQKVAERTKQLLEEQQKAERLAKVKQQFLANMSHEIRTPMNAIVGFTNLLLKSSFTEKQLKYLRAIEKSAQNLLVIVNDILDISKIEQGKMKIERIDVDLKVLIENLVTTFSESIDKPQLVIKSEIDPLIDIVESDQVRLNQIFTNLIGNAIKFTEKGEVNFIAQAITDTVNRQVIKFTITDTGIGIDKAKINSIFDSFSQADQSTTRRFGGTGLGLTITKQLVELLNGEITVVSEQGVGSTFEIIVPFNKGRVRKNKLTRSAMDLSKIKHLRILVAEDNDFNQFLIESIFEDWGLNFHIVNSGVKVIETLKDQEFDLILMDIQMPDMGGIDATRIVREKLNLKIPIVALTANALEEDKAKYLKEGMNAYISKPFREEELYYLIVKILNLSDTDVVTNLNLNYIHDVCRNDKVMIATMLSKIAKNLYDRVINNFIFKTPITESTLPHIRSSIHDIKSSIVMLDDDELLYLIGKLSEQNFDLVDVSQTFEEFTAKVAQLKSKIDSHIHFLKFGSTIP